MLNNLRMVIQMDKLLSLITIAFKNVLYISEIYKNILNLWPEEHTCIRI